MSDRLQRRVFAFAVVCALSVGVLVACVLLIASEGANVPALLLSRSAVANLATLSLAASLPYSAVGAIVGGFVAAKTVHASHAPQDRWHWIRRGCAWGFGLGAFSAASWVALDWLFGAINAGSALAVLAPIGAVAGSLSGALVGAYCHCAVERHHQSST